MDKVFHIRTFRSPNGAYREVELDLPATDYELFDLMEQLQLNDPNRIYLEIHPVEEYGYLDQRIQEPGLFQLNALAKRLAELDTHGMAAFEGLAAMDLQKGVKTIPAPLLINYACSGDSCHVVEDAVTDAELGCHAITHGNGWAGGYDTIHQHARQRFPDRRRSPGPAEVCSDGAL